MGVGLVSYIPDDLILGQIESQVKGHRQFHRPQIGTQMSSCNTDTFDEKITDLLCQFLQMFLFYVLDIIWLIDRIQKHILRLPFSLLRTLFFTGGQFTHQFL